MNIKKRVAVIGGDLRQLKMADCLCDAGYEVNVFGFDQPKLFCDSGTNICSSLEDALRDVDITVLGLPCSTDDENISTPLYANGISIKEFLRVFDKNSLLTGGRISDKVHNIFKVHNLYAIDYFEREELQVLNAIPSAEGAIQIAMEETGITIHGSSCLVLGFGRIGKILSKMLWGLGAQVTCTARKFSDIAWIKSYGYRAMQTACVADCNERFDIVFNTIPSRVLGIAELKNLPEDCLIIDLASKPGGVDLEAAKELGLRVIWALSLPGKVAPSTAGEIIKDTVINIINELGV